ncbi:MAG: hypothetical protein LBB76_01365 [Azoarcus sp.]|jgi:cytochrome c peroxidase|nr:hypothetical protein [Azoarcus sp.]
MARILTAGCALAFILLIFLLPSDHFHTGIAHAEWSADDLATLRHLRLSTDALAEKNKTNELLFRADAIALGRQLFHDTGLSGSGQISCASCHRPEAGYQDTEFITYKLDPQTAHRAPGILGAALQDWFFWDGRADSLWSQALAVIENPKELASDRVRAVRHLCAQYKKDFPALLKNCRGLSAARGEDIDRMFVTLGKSIAAFEAAELLPPVSRFDRYVDALDAGNYAEAAALLNDKEVAGLKLFLDPMVGCVNCHNGPMFTGSGFFAVATDMPGQLEHDRKRGVELLLDSEFNCLKWSTAADCPKLQYLLTDSAETAGAYKVPSLRNLRHAPFFMHDGRYRSLEAVIEHYRSPATLPLRHIDIRPAPLLPHQRKQLLAFLEVLGSGDFNKEQQ